MVGDDGGSSSVTSSPLQQQQQQHLSLAATQPPPAPAPTPAPAMPLGSPHAPWLRELKSDERGLYLIHLLLNCATHVAAGSLDAANAFLEHISLLSSPSGDTMQRIASLFSGALARRLLSSSYPGLLRSLDHTLPAPANSESLLARRLFFDLCPFLKLFFIVSNQAILEAMEGEKVVHVVDLGAGEPAQWLALLQALARRPEGPPHLRITAVGEQKELLDLAAARLADEAEKLDVPFQFHPVVSKLDSLDVGSLRVKSGEAVAISAVLQLHTLLAPDDDAGHHHHHHHHRKPAPNDPSSDSASSSSPPPPPASRRMERFLGSLWGLSPKVMVVAEQESSHNGASLSERFVESLNFYAAMFDCLESTAPARMSPERSKVEKALFGEEIKNIIACEGAERRERHERIGRWVQRLEAAGFARVAISYGGILQARRLLQSIGGCEGFKVRDDDECGGCAQICWQDRPLFSVSAWRCCTRWFD